MLLHPTETTPFTDGMEPANMVDNRPSSFIGQLFFDGVGPGDESGGGNGLGPLHITSNGNDGNNNVNVSKIAATLANITNDNWNAPAGQTIWVCSNHSGYNSDGIRPATWASLQAWRGLSRRAGIEKHIRTSPADGSMRNVATMPVLYFHAFVDMSVGDMLSKIVLPFRDTTGGGPLYRINVWMIEKFKPPARQQVNTVLPSACMGIYRPVEYRNTIDGDVLRAMFFSTTKPVSNVRIDGQEITPVRVGTFSENTTDKTLNGTVEIALNVPARASSGKVWFIVTLAPWSIPSDRQYGIGFSLNNASENYPNPRFVGIGVHCFDTPIATAYASGDDGTPVIVPNPDNPRKENYLGLGLNSSSPDGPLGARFIGSKRVVL